MKLKQYLNELALKSETKINIKKQKDKFFNAKIELEDGVTWLFNATNDFDEDEWDITFYSPMGNNVEIKDKHKTGLQTFAAVEKLVTQFIKEQKPGEFHFTGGANNRSLYDFLSKKILKTGKYKKGDVPKLLLGYKWSFIRK